MSANQSEHNNFVKDMKEDLDTNLNMKNRKKIQISLVKKTNMNS